MIRCLTSLRGKKGKDELTGPKNIIEALKGLKQQAGFYKFAPIERKSLPTKKKEKSRRRLNFSKAVVLCLALIIPVN